MKLVKKIFNNKKFTYGMQTLCGAPSEKKVIVGRFARLWLEDLEQFEDYDKTDVDTGKWFEENED